MEDEKLFSYFRIFSKRTNYQKQIHYVFIQSDRISDKNKRENFSIITRLSARDIEMTL